MRQRRVGTLTAGLVLIIFGVLFLLHTALPALSYLTIFRFWPAIFILLGAETLIGCLIQKEEKLRYDAAAIALVIVLSFFAMGMATVDYAIQNNLQQML